MDSHRNDNRSNSDETTSDAWSWKKFFCGNDNGNYNYHERIHNAKND